MTISKPEALETLKALVEKYRSDKLAKNYNETQLRIDYLNPLLEAFGWDVKNDKNEPQYLREVIQEESLDVLEADKLLKKKPDYTIRTDGKRKFFVEAKKPAISIKNSKEASFQIRRYGWNANLAISVLSNFESLIIYDCRFRPEPIDAPQVARLHVFSCEDYISQFETLYDLLSWDSVCHGKFDAIFGTDIIPKGAEPFDEYFLKQIDAWREKIAVSLLKNNKPSQAELNYLVQQTINRIIFLRICEDRELEKYEELKSITDYESLKNVFLKADKKYNSGLFHFIEDQLSLKVLVDADVLISIFTELYYPLNPYAFSVVGPHTLGAIYELFLSKELVISGEKLIVREKPEIVQSQGAVTTPQYIVDEIVKHTISPLINNKNPQDVKNLRIADIACGSGIFLLSAYDHLLNYHLEWYINNDPTKHPDKIIQLANGEFRLTLGERAKILFNNIFGVDIDQQAVEVSKFSLLLKTLEGVGNEEITSYIKNKKASALPNIDSNIQWGNSLVDNSFYKFNKKAPEAEQLVAINPFDFQTTFKAIFDNGGFDAIIGNPPYIRIQNIVKYSPLECMFFTSKYSSFKSAKTNNYDKYYLFIERSIELTKDGGYIGYIVPHKFATIKAGKCLRKIITDGFFLNHLTHFDVQQVFENKSSTYTCLLILKNSDNKKFEVEFVNDLMAWRYGGVSTSIIYEKTTINDEPWIFVPPQLEKTFSSLQKKTATTLKDEVNIFVGVQTSADKIYLIRPEKESKKFVFFTDKNDVKRKVERSILRPCLIDVPLVGFSQPNANAYMIFPYQIINDKAVLYTHDELQQLFPECWKYLYSHKKEMGDRTIQGYTPETWYRFGRSQSLIKFNGQPKLIWPVLSLEPRYSYDNENILITGGGNGPYYALRPKASSNLSIFYILAVLSHPIIEAFVRSRSSKFRGGYGSHGKQFIENIPLRKINFDMPAEKKLHDEIVKGTKQLIKTTSLFLDETTPGQKKIYERRIAVFRKSIFNQIEALFEFTEDDLKSLDAVFN